MRKPVVPRLKLRMPASDRGPLIFAAVISIAGLLYTLLGSVEVVPFLPEHRREPIRKMWAALSRNLPHIGHASLEKVAFWIIVALTALLCVAVLLAAATVGDTPEPETQSAE